MSDYGAEHELEVTYTDQGREVDGSDHNFRYDVDYLIRHPEGGCWTGGDPDVQDCPILDAISNVGIDEALGLQIWTRPPAAGAKPRYMVRHLPEGVYTVQAWAETYHNPEPESESGLRVEWKNG